MKRKARGEESYPPSVEFITDSAYGRFGLCNAVAGRARDLVAAWRGIPFQVARNPVEVVVEDLLSGELQIRLTTEEAPLRFPAPVAAEPEEEESGEELKAA